MKTGPPIGSSTLKTEGPKIEIAKTNTVSITSRKSSSTSTTSTSTTTTTTTTSTTTTSTTTQKFQFVDDGKIPGSGESSRDFQRIFLRVHAFFSRDLKKAGGVYIRVYNI